MNTLYFGDNIDILREFVPDESVDLIYLDPPFNSKRAHNIIFRDKDGKYPPSQIRAFDDTWSWGDEAEIIMDELKKPGYPPQLFLALDSFRHFLGHSDMMAYLVMMSIRLVEMHRVLRSTGSLYLHCDPTASHYLKVVMDRIFGERLFQHEIIWKCTSAHANAKTYGDVHQILFFYTKSRKFRFNRQFQPYDEGYIKKYYRYKDKNGNLFMSSDLVGHKGVNKEYEWHGIKRPWRYPKSRMDELEKSGRIFWTKNNFPRFKRYLEDMPGMPANTIWSDILPIVSWSDESLGYPTQKPVTLLERIISASSNEGDLILDPFCGCGTTVAAAEKLGRKWLGIDITILAINLIERRMREHFPDAKYELRGIPKDIDSARKMASSREGRFLFEQWFVIALGGQPFKSAGGADTGIDGFMYFKDIEGNFHRIIVQVKSGHYSRENIAALKSVVDRENAALGLMLVLDEPTKPSIAEAASAGRFQMPGVSRTYPRIQVFTVSDYFAGKRPDMPDVGETLKKAKRETREREKPQRLL